MATITVKNIPSELYEQLKRTAAANRRSINSEIIICIERSMRGRRLEPEELLERARRLRLLTRDHIITSDDFDAAKLAGRP